MLGPSCTHSSHQYASKTKAFQTWSLIENLTSDCITDSSFSFLHCSVARGSPKRQELYKQASHFQVTLHLLKLVFEYKGNMIPLSNLQLQFPFQKFSIFALMSVWQAPYLEDPNTGVKMFESAAIVDYLKATYAQ